MHKDPKSVLIFGSTGMLGKSLYLESKKRGFETIGASRNGQDASIDLRNKNDIGDLIFKHKPETVINSAALVSHSLCDENPLLANAINAEAVGAMATACNKIKARLLQISTDNYYTGDAAQRHDEKHSITLLSEYAKTKYSGEIFALTCHNSLVIRTNVTGFRSGNTTLSFIEWVIKSLESGKPFKLFNDYYTSTITSSQLASITFDILNHNIIGCLNIACREVTSKLKFVEAFAIEVGLSIAAAESISVHSILSGRAESVGLDVTKAENLLEYQLPNLNQVIKQLVLDYKRTS